MGGRQKDVVVRRRDRRKRAEVRTGGRQKDVVVRRRDPRKRAEVRMGGHQKDVVVPRLDPRTGALAREPGMDHGMILERPERSARAAGPGVPLRCEQARASVPVLRAQCGGARSAVPEQGLPVPFCKSPTTYRSPGPVVRQVADRWRPGALGVRPDRHQAAGS